MSLEDLSPPVTTAGTSGSACTRLRSCSSLKHLMSAWTERVGHVTGVVLTVSEQCCGL